MKRSRILAAALIVLYLMGGGLGVPCVLCFTSEGHLSLETSAEACGSCCSGPALPESSPSGERGHGWEHEPCQSCIDIPLSTAGDAPPGLRQAKEGPLTPGECCPAPAGSFPRVPARHLLDGPPDAPPAAGILAQLRTVILRR
jgi:hypothetical protein